MSLPCVSPVTCLSDGVGNEWPLSKLDMMTFEQLDYPGASDR